MPPGTSPAPPALEPFIVSVEHIAIVVRSIDVALRTYGGNLRLAHRGTEEVARDKVRVAFLATGESHLELVEPIDPAGDSGVARFLAKRGEGFHHLAFRVRDIDAALRSLAVAGVALLDPHARPGSRGTRVAFLHPKSCHGVLVELVDGGTRA